MSTQNALLSKVANQCVPRRAAYPKNEARALLGGISTATLDRWIKDGKLRALKPGNGIVLIPETEIQRFLGSDAATA